MNYKNPNTNLPPLKPPNTNTDDFSYYEWTQLRLKGGRSLDGNLLGHKSFLPIRMIKLLFVLPQQVQQSYKET